MKKHNFLLPLVFMVAVALSSSAYDLSQGYAPVSAQTDSGGQNSVQFEAERNEYIFGYKEEGCDLVYSVHTRDSNAMKGMISVRAILNGGDRMVPIYQGGLIAQEAEGKVWLPNEIAGERTFQLVSHELRDGAAVLNYEEKIKDRVLHKVYRFSIRGKTLVMEATGDITNVTAVYYTGFDFGKSRYTQSPVIYRFPSVSLPIVGIDKKYYLSTYIDPLLSSTGRYERTENVLQGRTMQVSNTPAWLVEDIQGRRPPMQIVAYLTISNRALDVLPTAPLRSDWAKNPIRQKTIVDIHQLPFLRLPFLPLETVRRWEAPESGWVDLEGAFQLHTGESAHCALILQEADQEKDRVLFSQILQASQKPAAGMKGRFPVKKGDHLLFTIASPAIMNGGEALLDVRFKHEGESYSSYADFSSQQGERGWYYEQRIGKERTLMVWNPDLSQWESPFTRSFQNGSVLVSRGGASGDAFATAAQFFDTLRELGLKDLCILVRGWCNHARFAIPPDSHHSEHIWGEAGGLLSLSEREINRDNLFVPVIGTEILENAEINAGLSNFVLSMMKGPSLSTEGFVGKTIHTIRDSVGEIDKKLHRRGLWFEAPDRVDRIQAESLYYQLLGVPEPSTRAVAEDFRKHMQSIREFAGEPVLVEWRDSKTRYDLFGGFAVDGVAAPLLTDSNILNGIDEEVHRGRLLPRIGFGSYAGFYQSPTASSTVDLRMFPLDQYMTSTIVLARVPLISGNVWYPEFSGREMRRYLLETIALMQPVAREYLNGNNAVLSVHYQTDTESGKEQTLEEIIQHDLVEKANRVTIRYANGLQIRANRSSQSWSVDLEPNSMGVVARDGFFAVNPSSGLLVAIGQEGSRTFSFCRTPSSYFLHSRDGGLIRQESFSTDGMIHRWKSPIAAQSDMACLGITEVNQINPIQPLLRSNKRIDCSVRWISEQEVEIHILDAGEGPILLEFFDADSAWFSEEGKNLAVSRKRDGEETPSNVRDWYTTVSSSRAGIRFFDVAANERLTLTYTAAIQSTPLEEK